MLTDALETHRVLYAVLLGRDLSPDEEAHINRALGGQKIDPVALAEQIKTSAEYHARSGGGGVSADWRPFHEAPKNGQMIDLWHPQKGVIPEVRWMRIREVAARRGYACPPDFIAEQEASGYDGWRRRWEQDNYSHDHHLHADVSGVTHWKPSALPPG